MSASSNKHALLKRRRQADDEELKAKAREEEKDRQVDQRLLDARVDEMRTAIVFAQQARRLAYFETKVARERLRASEEKLEQLSSEYRFKRVRLEMMQEQQAELDAAFARVLDAVDAEEEEEPQPPADIMAEEGQQRQPDDADDDDEDYAPMSPVLD